MRALITLLLLVAIVPFSQAKSSERERALRVTIAAQHRPGATRLNLSGQGWGPNVVPMLARADLSWVRSLDLSGNRLGDRGVAALVKLPLVGKLQSLDLSDNRLGSDGIEALALAPGLSGLRELALAFNTLQWRSLPTLLKSPHLRGLTALDLGYNYLGDKGVVALLSELRPGQLKRLSLAGNRIRNPGAKALLESPRLAGLTHLDLGGRVRGPVAHSPPFYAYNNSIGTAAAKALARSPHLAQLVELDLSYCGLGQTGDHEILHSGRLKKLRRLVIPSRRDLHRVIDTPVGRRLEALTLYGWQGGGGAQLASSGGLRRKLHTLELLEVSAESAQVQALARAVAGGRLRSLSVGGVEAMLNYVLIDKAAARALGSLVGLEHLSIPTQSIGDAEMLLLLRSPAARTLRTLRLFERTPAVTAAMKALPKRTGKPLRILEATRSRTHPGKSERFNRDENLDELDDAAVRALAGSLCGANRLSLYGSAKAIKRVLDSPCLRELTVLELYITDPSVASISTLVRSPSMRGVVDLRLQANELDDTMLAAIAKSARFENLRFLALGGGDFGDRGMLALAKSPSLSGLTHLFLLDSNTSFAAGARLAASRRLPKLTVLLLGEDENPDPAAKASDALEKTLSRQRGGGAFVYGYSEDGA